MQRTYHPCIGEMLAQLLAGMQRILGPRLAGLYLYGSLVTGDFDLQTSDIDLLAAVATDVTDLEFERLQQLHDAFHAGHAEWDGRIEVAYLSLAGLQTFKTQTSRMAVMSPGEPFHLKGAGRDYLINWWIVRRQGVALYGPPPAEIIAPVSQGEFREAVRQEAQGWREWVYESHHRRAQAYTVLTLCRALYACTVGEQPSKAQAARWVQERYPQWASLAQQALVWRDDWRNEDVDHEATFPETVRFVNFAVDQIEAGSGPAG